MTSSWHSYPSLFTLGHRAIQDLLLDPVVVEEKIDGSQFSFGIFNRGTPDEGIRIRSKGVEMNIDEPEKMFTKARDTVAELAGILTPDWTYRAEYLQKPKHNTLAYDRVPERHLIVFDINRGHDDFLPPAEKQEECRRIGLECVPAFYHGAITDVAQFRELLEQTSILGGQKVEGVVVKNYARFGIDKRPLFGKFVSELFKEVHAGEWKKSNPSNGDILDIATATLRTPARWMKAVQHLREAGRLENSPRDIGNLIKEVQADLEKECQEEIAAQLLKWAWPHVTRGAIRGLPEWYKQQLLEQQFANTATEAE